MFSLFKKSQSAPAQLPVATDIHCHIVPGVDDGSPDVSTSVELIDRLRGIGFKRIFASPHVTGSVFENTEETLAGPLAELNAALRAKDGFSIDRHAEYRLDDFFVEQLEKGAIKALPGNFILVENSFLQEPWNLEQLVYELKLKGYNPILAHPERYGYYQHHRERYHQLHSSGLCFQINLLSLADHYGGEERETAEWLISQGLVDFLGSDVHRHNHLDSIEAYLRTKRAARHFEALQGKLLNDRL
ncbi:MAG: hypothetical protein NC187_06530 [Candidatus Amulumruptor caecigallinarius]|nr:hypothetical protein [Candidatus Amulumruptor caecigallinarius]MCM1397125.1 hypothetical protein [Candidatus Amulumruptor caecigallinarius]MCM1453935.1 hypothetical protein [bacterium]